MEFERHKLFEKIVEASPDPIAIHCDYELVYINKAGANLLGSTMEALIGKSILKIVHPDYWDDSRNQVDQILRGQASKSRKISLVGEHGQIIEVSINSTLTSYMGKPAVLVSYRDITEQQHVEKVLRESKELVTDILESITDAVFAVDHNWCFTYMNRIGENYMGKNYADIMGKNLWEEFPALVDTNFYGAYHKALTEKVVMEFEEYSPSTKRWYEVRAFPTKDGLTVYYKSITERKNAEEKAVYYSQELEKSKSELEHVFNNIDAGVWSVDLIAGKYMLSKGIEKLYGYPVQAFYEDPTFWMSLVHPDDRHLAENQDKLQFSGESSVHRYRMIHANGSVRVIRNRITPILDQSNNLVKIVGIFVDITEQERMEQSIRESQEWLATTLKCIGDGVIATDITGRITFMNPIAETLTAWKQEEVLGADIGKVLRLVNEQTRAEVTNPVSKVIQEKRIVGLANHTVLINKEGVEIPIDDSAAPILNDLGDMTGIVMVFRDVIERKRYEEKIKHYAFHDALTGLPNRRLFNDRLTIALANAKRNNKRLATMFLDLDRFKQINDTLGHEIGDLLLIEVANRLMQSMREGDTVARLGGDEFIILLEDIHVIEVSQMVRRITDKLAEKFIIHHQTLFTSSSIGTSFYPEDGDDVESLIKHADMAMYYVKGNGKNNHQFFAPFMNDKTLRKMHIDKGLREALNNNEFQLVYQPKVDLVTGCLSGVEALLRWHQPELGIVSPGEFIPVAEEIGMIAAIGEWVLKTACIQCVKWKNSDNPPLRVAINISTLQFRHPDFVADIRRILQDTDLDPNDLELEITESVMQNEESIKKLFELKALGVYISIDDFGTGYSSLSYLKRLPIDILKIDKSFINDIYVNPTDAAIVTTIITLAKSLNLRVIAEGVETEEQLKFLMRYKCDEAQGFYIGKPVSSSEYETMLKSIRGVVTQTQFNEMTL